MRPFTQRSRVLLPQPLGPAISSSWPGSSARSIPPMAGAAPLRYWKLRASMVSAVGAIGIADCSMRRLSAGR
jgi:hypothetical protein